MHSQELIQETIRVWQPRFNHPLTENEVVEIIDRWAALLKVISDSLASMEEV